MFSYGLTNFAGYFRSSFLSFQIYIFDSESLLIILLDFKDFYAPLIEYELSNLVLFRLFLLNILTRTFSI